MIDLLVSVIILCVVAGLVWWLVQMLPILEPFMGIIRVCVVVIAILLVLSVAFGGVSLPMVHLRR